ncbi:hypothetical protein DWB84_07760 [Saccharophagus sp. K07]|jgi:DsbC/DsbD-like thiol-disulfide interchange protein|uniref:hypothetical protein n=1 Tax=Saccharophagus sp. K07 TaxID=2283636 RepID=UPI001651DEFF|nr:hypothetical protein [Saccharophagus sp. K07]MBC6905351.1 hypothetical protein [Saccharophagus sp. K07]
MPTALSFACTFLLGALLVGCAQKTVKPEPQSIRLRGDASVTQPATAGTIKKDLFNIVVGPDTIKVNGVAFKNIAELDKFLSGYQQPALTVATHKCLSNEKAAEVIGLAQRHTDVPIAFGSYGNYDDPECKTDTKSKKRR